MVLNNILDQYISTNQILFKLIKGFRNYEILNTFTLNFNSLLTPTPPPTTKEVQLALPYLCPGELIKCLLTRFNPF